VSEEAQREEERGGCVVLATPGASHARSYGKIAAHSPALYGRRDLWRGRNAGEWDKARPLFDKVVGMAPKDADWLAEIGSYYNLKGDRAHAEELFARSLAEDPENVYNTTKMAGSYIGVAPD
jgi:tetratricopeptide (TPR) repeat protein